MILFYICDVLQEKVTYFGKCNFTAERKIVGNLKKVEFHVLIDTCSRSVWEPSTLSKNSVWFLMGKNFGSWHVTVAFFTRSVPILTPTGVNKRQFYDNFLNRIRFSCTIVAKLSCLRLSGTNISTRQQPYKSTYVIEDRFRYTTGIKVSHLRLSWTKSIID